MIQISDYHAHAFYSDGKNSMREMVEMAFKMGLLQFGISEHSNGWDTPRGKKVFFETPEKFQAYILEARELQKEFPFFRIGLECDIKEDGTLAVPEYLAGRESERYGLDYLIASVHPEKFSGNRKDLVGLFEHALQNYPIDIIGHLFQPLLGNSLGFFDEIESSHMIKSIKSVKRPVCVEINGNLKPFGVESEQILRRGRYDYSFLETCVDEDVKLAFGSDAHRDHQIGRYPTGLHSHLRLRYANGLMQFDINGFMQNDIPIRG